MAGVLDLDAIVVETTEIAKTIDGKRRVWALRDDIPPEIMLQCFRLMGHAELQSGAVSELRATMDTDDPASVVSAVETLEQAMLAQAEEVTHICGNIFRHSYPETTDEEMRRWFRDDERTRIVQLFFYPPIAGVFDAISRYNSDADPEPAAETGGTGSGPELASVVGRDPVAEALIARVARAERAVASDESQNGPERVSEGQETASGGGLDILDVLDAMASHYGETTREMLTRWSWKLFCARWRRLVEYMEVEREKRRDREREETFRRLRAETEREHQERPPVFG